MNFKISNIATLSKSDIIKKFEVNEKMYMKCIDILGNEICNKDNEIFNKEKRILDLENHIKQQRSKVTRK
jgi:hypothetical protein